MCLGIQQPIKKYVCIHCELRFYSNAELKSHKRNKHIQKLAEEAGKLSIDKPSSTRSSSSQPFDLYVPSDQLISPGNVLQDQDGLILNETDKVEQQQLESEEDSQINETIELGTELFRRK